MGRVQASAPSSSRQGGWSKDAGGGARQQADHAAITKELEGAKVSAGCCLTLMQCPWLRLVVDEDMIVGDNGR